MASSSKVVDPPSKEEESTNEEPVGYYLDSAPAVLYGSSKRLEKRKRISYQEQLTINNQE